jgi:hypothetical protein
VRENNYLNINNINYNYIYDYINIIVNSIKNIMKLFNIKFTNENFDTFMKVMKPCINNDNIVDRNFLSVMLESMLDANEYVDTVSFIRQLKDKKNSELNVNNFNSIFLPNLIKNYIIENDALLFEYKTSINQKLITINFYIYHDILDKSKSNLNQDIIVKMINLYDYYCKLILMWIYILNKYSKKSCGNKLRIDIYHTPFKKELPYKKGEVLGPINANTAFTSNCSKNSEIIIFRKEEWFKVFIHETMHNFDLDFSLMNQTILNKNIKKIFPINSKMNLFEAYCDFWARIILSCFNSFIFLTNDKYNIKKNKKDLINLIDKKEFYKTCDLFIEIERVFTLYQANKVLRFMGLNYIDFISDETINKNYNETKLLKFKEDTNIFSYYIVTAILLCEYNKFINWCQMNNRLLFKFNNTNRHLKLFENYIIDVYNNDNIIDNFSCLEKILDYVVERNKNKSFKTIKKINLNTSHSKKYYDIINTMRMSFIELI